MVVSSVETEVEQEATDAEGVGERGCKAVWSDLQGPQTAVDTCTGHSMVSGDLSSKASWPMGTAEGQTVVAGACFMTMSKGKNTIPSLE